MLPEKLYIIREILKELDMSYGMAYLKTVYSELLRQSTRDLYDAGEVEAYKRAVRLEVTSNFSTTVIAQKMSKDLAEKIKLHMHLSNRNLAYITKQTGLSTAVVNELLEGNGTMANFLIVMMSLGLTLQTTDINSFHKQSVKEEERSSVAVISPIMVEDYIKAQNALDGNIRDYSEVGGNLLFGMTPIGTDIIVSGIINYKLTEEEAESNAFKIETKEFLVSVLIYPELREKLVADFLKKPNAIAMSLGGKYIITVEQLLNSLYQVEGDDAYYMLIKIPYRLRAEEDLIIADHAYVITMNVNGVSTSSTMWISKDNITFRGILVDENGEEIPGDIDGPTGGDDGGQTPDQGGDTGTDEGIDNGEQPGGPTDGEGNEDGGSVGTEPTDPDENETGGDNTTGTEPIDPDGTGSDNEPETDNEQGTTPEPTDPPTGENDGERVPENEDDPIIDGEDDGEETAGDNDSNSDGTGTDSTVSGESELHGEGETGTTTEEEDITGETSPSSPPTGENDTPTDNGDTVSAPDDTNSGTGADIEPTPGGDGTTDTGGTENGGGTTEINQ